MPETLPAITGPQLIKLLVKDGWQTGRQAKHGLTTWKRIGNRNVVAYIPTKNESLPAGTLGAILGPKQTNMRRKGLSDLIDKYGLG